MPWNIVCRQIPVKVRENCRQKGFHGKKRGISFILVPLFRIFSELQALSFFNRVASNHLELNVRIEEENWKVFQGWIQILNNQLQRLARLRF